MEQKGSVKKQRILTMVVIGWAVVGFSTLGLFYALSTPYYSLYMLKRAIIDRNADGVLKYLDTDSILDSMAKDFFFKMDSDTPARNKFEESMQGVGKDMAVQLLPQLKAQMAPAITQLLLSYNDDELFANLKKANVLGLSVTVEGNRADVRARGKDTVSFTMAKVPEGHWRITSLNPDELKMLWK